MESLASVLDEAIDGHTYHAPTRFLALPKDGKMLGESSKRGSHWQYTVPGLILSASFGFFFV
jgi:hypothetical protein